MLGPWRRSAHIKFGWLDKLQVSGESAFERATPFHARLSVEFGVSTYLASVMEI